MTWAKVDDQLHAHPKALAAGPEAMGLWVLCLSHCAAYLTDGHVDEGVVLGILARWRVTPRSLARRKTELSQALVDAGLWRRTATGWQFHDWERYQPTRAQVLEINGKRVEAGRRSAVARGQNAPTLCSTQAPAFAPALAQLRASGSPVPVPVPSPEIPLTPAERGDGNSSRGEPQHDGRNPRARGTSPRQLAEAQARAEAESRAARYAATPDPEPPPPRAAVASLSASEQALATPAALATLAASIGRPGAFR
jgi:hypothetical protein